MILGTKTSSDINSSTDINTLSTRAFDKQGTGQVAGLSEGTPETGDWLLAEKGDSSQALVKFNKDDVGGTSSRSLQIVLAGNAYTGTGLRKIRVPYAMTVAKVRLGAGTPGTGSGNNTYDVNYHATDPDSATSIFSSLPSLAAAAHTGESTSLSTTSLAAGGWLVIDCDAVTATTPAADVTIEILE